MARYYHVARLMEGKRRQSGYATSKGFHGSLPKPPIEYQSWAHIEAGRRLPKPETASKLAQVLGIEQQEMMKAYMADLFQDESSRQILEHWGSSRDSHDTLVKARMLNREAYRFNSRQILAMIDDPLLALALTAPTASGNTLHIESLALHLEVDLQRAEQIAQQLEELELAEWQEPWLHRRYSSTVIAQTDETLPLRKKLLMHHIAKHFSKETFALSIHADLSLASLEAVKTSLDQLEAQIYALDDRDAQGGEVDEYHIACTLSRKQKPGLQPPTFPPYN